VTAVKALSDSTSVGNCVELFTGLGGLARGLHDAGFRHSLLVERDAQAARTIRDNELTRAWPLHDGDLREVDFVRDFSGSVDLLAAGVPCQPFSQAGVHAGPADERNMFPETFAAIRELRPRAVLIENVRGLARPAFRPFVEYIVDHLALPGLARGKREGWPGHHKRLKRVLRQPVTDPTERYVVEWRPVRVADYGVAQRRVRILMVAVRSDMAHRWAWPEPTHSHEVLLLDQLDGFYWAQHGLPPRSPVLAAATRGRVRKLVHPTPVGRWRTLRDVISDLPEPTPRGQVVSVDGHIFWPGARLYRGHRGSDLDLPSKTIKAGVHGVAGGEHIVHLDTGEHRYLTVRECMRVQDLPDEMRIDAPRTVAMRQIGNAVPPTIGRVFGVALADAVCDPPRVPKQVHVREQDEAAGGFLLRQVIVHGQRVTASVRLQKDYAYLYWTRSAGAPLYLGRVASGSKQERLTEAWRIAHEQHQDLFVAPADRAA
jgi:DNA (cytosine-5)-methyltransferase 1